MALTPGTRLGSFEIVALLGAGGMGEVYRAHDARLRRDVAIKILPEVFASDRERLTRFEREAQLLAALNHPGIAQIYGVEESGPVRAIVMELVNGSTLAERISRGPLPLNEVLSIGQQLATALGPRTNGESSIAISSPPTSSSPPKVSSRFSTSVWHARPKASSTIWQAMVRP